ncbi:bactofilin family protein [Kluyvera sp. 142486]|uniref:bactofilin family protein n=1 Tax=Kluyvera sp. 142486 TaxID=3390050 RepID=UPI0039801F90
MLIGREFLAVNCAIIFWLLALIAWFFNVPSLAYLSGACTLSSFITHIKLNQANHMFKKNKSADVSPVTSPTSLPGEEKEPIGAKKQDATVVASNVCFEGNIASNGHVYIYGSLKGNIEAAEGLIKIIHGGLVEGNINCRELIIDGSVVGQCSSQSLEIAENGHVVGTIAYHTLAIKKGGKFSGQAEILPAETKKNNTYSLAPQPAASGDTAKSAEKNDKKKPA